MKRNMFQWLEEVRNAKAKKAMPILSFPCVSLLGISVKELISNSDSQSKGIKAVADRVDSLASVSLMDLSVEAECFGSQIRVSDDEVPTVVGSVVSSLEDAENMRVPKVGDGRTSIYIESIRKAVELIKDRPVLAGVIGPYSLAGRLVDVTQSMIYCYEEPEMMSLLLSKITDFLIEYAKEYKKAGANGMVIAEPLAGLLSPALINEFSEPYVRRLIEAVQDENFIVVYHNCGNSTPQLLDSILSVGAKIYHFGDAIDISEMLKKIPENLLVSGNVSPSNQFRNGTPESIKKNTTEIMTACRNHGNFIISSGCDIPPMSPWENIDAFFQAVREFNA
jgi:uroporphyrinogen decarboxylase